MTNTSTHNPNLSVGDTGKCKGTRGGPYCPCHRFFNYTQHKSTSLLIQREKNIRKIWGRTRYQRDDERAIFAQIGFREPRGNKKSLSISSGHNHHNDPSLSSVLFHSCIRAKIPGTKWEKKRSCVSILQLSLEFNIV